MECLKETKIYELMERSDTITLGILGTSNSISLYFWSKLEAPLKSVNYQMKDVDYMLESIYKETKENMGKSIAALKKDLNKVRTGRASLSLLDGILVDYYGTRTLINQMASLSVPESRLIIIQPWDITVIKDIEKAILKSDLGITPSNDGKIIRISIPALTEERRMELVKIVRKICEDYKVAVRNIRRDSNELIKGLKKDGDISEDDAFKAQDQIQKITDEQIKLINDDIFKEKEKEILEF